ncbi:transcription initiation factor TFIID component TAF4 family-domain-containing protein [Chlamydoabsidia padenii]|nr:transcription initiation factor TFIID component TAF4 family-domain-containing protein [Chlamydoabsidia padenii]
MSSDLHQQRIDLGTDSSYQQVQFNNTTQQSVESPLATYMNTELLASMMDKLAKSMDVPNLENGVVLYLALATQRRLQECITNMIEASRHRVESQTVEPPLLDNNQPYKVNNVQDIRKQLLAIERVEREEERKRRQAMTERERNANLSDGGGGPPGGGDDGVDAGDDDTGNNKKKKKKKKEMGPGAAARNMSEDIYKQATNKTALMSAGGIRKSWMLAGMSNAAASKEAPSSIPSSSSSSSSSSTATATTTATTTLETTSTSTITSLPPPQPLSTKLPSSSSNRSSLTSDFNTATLYKAESPSTEDTVTRGGRGRPRGRKSEGTKRGRSSSAKRDRDFYLPPSMIGRHHSQQNRLGEQPSRTITIVDAVHALEHELDSGCGCGNKALIKSYNQYLK